MPKKFGRIHLVVMDSVGIGAAPDADKFFNHDVETHEAINDVNSDTIGHISEIRGLDVPNLQNWVGEISRVKVRSKRFQKRINQQHMSLN